ncbi:hypothetical protein NCCP2165_10340 [Halomonas sp. NCCP-2165]|nr:hypothetical protein NCCP2165_10340 [Halomonas sp. NCCP-2165]
MVVEVGLDPADQFQVGIPGHGGKAHQGLEQLAGGHIWLLSMMGAAYHDRPDAGSEQDADECSRAGLDRLAKRLNHEVLEALNDALWKAS